MTTETSMGEVFLRRSLKPFTERLRAYCLKREEDPDRQLFEQHFDDFRREHINFKVPIKTLYAFMVTEEGLKASLAQFRRWWHEMAPEDKRPRKKKAQAMVDTQGESTQSQ